MEIVYILLGISVIFLIIMWGNIKVSEPFYELHKIDVKGEIHYEITYRYLIFFRLTYKTYLYESWAEVEFEALNNGTISHN